MDDDNVGEGADVEAGAGATTGCVVDDVSVEIAEEEDVVVDDEMDEEEVVAAARAGFLVDFGTQLALVVPL